MTVTEQLWRDHADDVRSFLQRRVATPQDADDLLQEVFLRAVRTPPAKPGPAWLYTVARTVLTDHHRRAVHHREAPVAAIAEVAAEDAPEPNPDAVRAARCAAGMLPRLPAEQAEALRLVDMSAVKQHQAAQAVGVSLSGMKSRVQRGRSALRALVDVCCKIRRDVRGAVMDMDACSSPCGC